MMQEEQREHQLRILQQLIELAQKDLVEMQTKLDRFKRDQDVLRDSFHGNI